MQKNKSQTYLNMDSIINRSTPVMFKTFKTIDVQNTYLCLGIIILSNRFINILNKPEKRHQREGNKHQKFQLSNHQRKKTSTNQIIENILSLPKHPDCLQHQHSLML